MKYKFIEFKVMGIPVKIHFSIVLAVIVLVLVGFSDKFLSIGGFSLILIMLIHELGHAWLAKKNDLAVYSIELYLFFGFCHYQDDEYDYKNYIVSWGGVLAQLFVFIPAFLISYFFSEFLPENINIILFFMGGVNLITALFNLLPIQPLDGASCWKSIPIFFSKRRINKRAQKKG